MNKEQLLQALAEDLRRPGAVSFLERNEYGNWQARCGACGWVDHKPTNCPIHDSSQCWHSEEPRRNMPRWNSTRQAAINHLNEHLMKEHGFTREEVER